MGKSKRRRELVSIKVAARQVNTTPTALRAQLQRALRKQGGGREVDLGILIGIKLGPRMWRVELRRRDDDEDEGES